MYKAIYLMLSETEWTTRVHADKRNTKHMLFVAATKTTHIHKHELVFKQQQLSDTNT